MFSKVQINLSSLKAHVLLQAKALHYFWSFISVVHSIKSSVLELGKNVKHAKQGASGPGLKNTWLSPFVNAKRSSPRHSQGHLLSAAIIWTPLRCTESINTEISKLYLNSSMCLHVISAWVKIWPERKTAFCSRATTSRSAHGERDTMQSCNQSPLCPVVSSSTYRAKRRVSQKETFKRIQSDLSGKLKIPKSSDNEHNVNVNVNSNRMWWFAKYGMENYH